MPSPRFGDSGPAPTPESPGPAQVTAGTRPAFPGTRQNIAKYSRSEHKYHYIQQYFLRPVQGSAKCFAEKHGGTTGIPLRCAFQGKYDEAQPLLERALAINEVALGMSHEYTIRSRRLIGGLYKKQGFFEKASSLLEEAVNTVERLHGPDHRTVADALQDRAELLATQVRAKYIRLLPADASTLFFWSFQGLADASAWFFIFVFRDPSTSAGLPLGTPECFGASRHAARHTLLVFLGRYSASSLFGCISLIELCVHVSRTYLQGKYAEAQPLVERVMAINGVSFGTDHERTVSSRVWLGSLYSKQGLFDKASPLLEEVSSTLERVHGPDHPWVATALFEHAAMLDSRVRRTRCFLPNNCLQNRSLKPSRQCKMLVGPPHFC